MDIPLCQSEHKPQLLLNDPAAISLYHTAPERFAGALAPNAELCDAWAEELAPLPVGLAVARRRLGVRKNQMAMVGDQIFTDRLAAGLYGISCLYTMPRGGDHQRGVQFKRRFEPYWLDRYYQKGGRLYE